MPGMVTSLECGMAACTGRTLHNIVNARPRDTTYIGRRRARTIEPEESSIVAELTKLSVEKALNSLRKNSPESKSEQRGEEMAALDAEIKRMRAQRLRLRHQGPKRD